MVGAKDKSKLGYRILLGAVVLVLGGSMLLYLVPQSPVSGEVSADTVARIGDESVSVQDVRQQLNQIEQRNPNMKPLEALYAQQILKQLVFQKEIEYASTFRRRSMPAPLLAWTAIPPKSRRVSN